MRAIKAPLRAAALFALLTTLACDAEVAETLNLSPLHLEWPSNWSFDASKRVIEGKGSNGEKVLIMVLRRSEPSPSGKEVDRLAMGPKADLTIVRELSAFPVAEGKTGYSAAWEYDCG